MSRTLQNNRALRPSPSFHRPPPQPASAAALFETDHPASIASAWTRLLPGSELRREGGPAATCSVSLTSLEGATLVRYRSSCQAVASASALDSAYVLATARSERVLARVGVTTVDLSPGRWSLLLSPGHPISLHLPSGCELEFVRVERSALDRHLLSLTGRRAGRLVFELPVDLDTAGGKVVAGLGTLLVEIAAGGRETGLFGARLQDAFLTGMLTVLPHSASHLFVQRGGGIAPAYVRKAEAFIAEHAREPLRLADIAAAAGVSARSLQAAFRRSRGQRPLDALRDQRLELARQDLLEAREGTKVAEVATSLGFGGSQGRFAARYRQRFGESPQETLRGGRRRR
ncbi:MAG: AraC family transcriptional regulator [Polyangiaceae bacterium]